MGINFLDQGVPDVTTPLHFRHLLEENSLNKLFFETINWGMVASGHMMKSGMIVDAAIIDAPSSTKNAERKRVSEIHQAKKGRQWRIGTKCHIDVDAGSGLGPYYRGHRSKRTQRNNCVQVNPSGRRGGVQQFQISGNPKTGRDTSRPASRIHRLSNQRCPKSLPKVSDRAIDWERHIERRRSAVRCKVERTFRIVKRQFFFHEIPYLGLAKNESGLSDEVFTRHNRGAVCLFKGICSPKRSI